MLTCRGGEQRANDTKLRFYASSWFASRVIGRVTSLRLFYVLLCIILSGFNHVYISSCSLRPYVSCLRVVTFLCLYVDLNVMLCFMSCALMWFVCFSPHYVFMNYFFSLRLLGSYNLLCRCEAAVMFSFAVMSWIGVLFSSCCVVYCDMESVKSIF